MDRSPSPPASPSPAETASSPDPFDGVGAAIRRLPTGARLFRQGDETFGVFRLLAGRIRLIRVTPGGAEVPMHTVRPGELFAEASLFAARYHCDALALRDCEVLVYPKAALSRGLREDPEALWRFAADLARRVQDLRGRLELRQIRGAPERLLQFLRLHGGASGLCPLEGNLKQLAEEIGLTHEALYRTLAKLEREGRIARCPEGIRLLPDP